MQTEMQAGLTEMQTGLTEMQMPKMQTGLDLRREEHFFSTK